MFFSKEEWNKMKISQKVEKHPLPWDCELKYGKQDWFYQFRDANGTFVMNVDDPQDAHELMKIINGSDSLDEGR